MRKSDPNDYELRDEYDFSKMTIVPKGRYASRRRIGKNVVLLAPDVMHAFPSDESVNNALRLVMQIAHIPSKRKVRAANTARAKARTVASSRLVPKSPA
jgi:hypothetical protein